VIVPVVLTTAYWQERIRTYVIPTGISVCRVAPPVGIRTLNLAALFLSNRDYSGIQPRLIVETAVEVPITESLIANGTSWVQLSTMSYNVLHRFPCLAALLH